MAKIESQDLLLSVFASQQTGEGVRLTNCIAHVLKLNGTVSWGQHCPHPLAEWDGKLGSALPTSSG